MRKLMSEAWLLSLASMLGMAASTSAQDNLYVKQAEAIFGAAQPPLIQQVAGEECGPAACIDPCLTDACDSAGCGKGFLFGSDEPFDLGDQLFEEGSGWDIGGWMSWGYTNRSDGLFNTHPGRFNNNQSWLYAEKIADGSNGVGFGGRVDLLYGVDAQNTQAFGNNPGVYDFQNGWDHGIYGWALPQLYGEVAYGDWNIKAGHFYTLLGYEVVGAAGNFFYSHAFTMNNSEAFTHTGVLATYSASDNVTVYGGWTLGWDTGFDQLGQGNSFLGGLSVGVTDDLTVTYILTAGNLGWFGTGYTHSIVADWIINDNWEYVAQSDLVSLDQMGPGNTAFASSIGLNQYLFYKLSDQVKLGGRMEWWKAGGESYYGITGGVNYRPIANLVIRPEVRYQWSPAYNALNNGLVPVDEGAIFGIDAVLTF